MKSKRAAEISLAVLEIYWVIIAIVYFFLKFDFTTVDPSIRIIMAGITEIISLYLLVRTFDKSGVFAGKKILVLMMVTVTALWNYSMVLKGIV
ncbi:MAG: hypothetical protein PUG43_02995 [Clostridiales bacterium]|nr:hypothetical protein [Clostridiales bacterium]MDD7347477.1 hypothetical protein [Clostridiales bacterium]MDY4061223.1 hypothetical protein [Anaerovoracaceae bacterium]